MPVFLQLQAVGVRSTASSAVEPIEVTSQPLFGAEKTGIGTLDYVAETLGPTLDPCRLPCLQRVINRIL
jgi:hypothetical protein